MPPAARPLTLTALPILFHTGCTTLEKPKDPEMPIVNRLPRPQRDWALFLDVDGTLVEIADTPDGVVPDARLPQLLARRSEDLGGAVALISGRPIEMLDRLFAPLRLPVAGLHGLERRCADGTLRRAPVSPAILQAASAARAFVRDRPGLLVEDKGATIALHYRQAPQLEDAVTAFAEATAETLPGTTLQRGKMVVEIRPAGDDKGTVIGAFMSEPPFEGRTPVFIGDDVTDEAGFIEVLRRNGHAIRIGDSRPTAASYRIESVPELLDWLESWSLTAPA